VYIATQMVLFRERFLLSDNIHQYSKINSDTLDNCKKALYDAGYYNKSPQLAPQDCFMTSSQEKALAKMIKEDWSKFQGPFRGYRVSDTADIRAFLGQFLIFNLEKNEREMLLEGVISILKNITIIDRDLISSHCTELLDWLKQNDGNKESVFCRFGSYQDSSSIMVHNATTVLKEHGKTVYETMREALKTEKISEKIIVLMDDASYSMTQIVGVFEELMGKGSFEQHHVDALDDTEKGILYKCDIVLSFIYFVSKNLEELKTRLENLGFSKERIKIHCMHDFPKKVFERENIFKNDKIASVTRKYMEEAGVELLKSTKIVNGKCKDGWTKERMENGGLGYNDAQQTIISTFNTPTYTLTPLWCSGKIYDVDWMPLFPRTDKKQRFILRNLNT
jgi:hypothetical protein